MKRAAFFLCPVGILLVAVGCGDSAKDQTYDLSGMVNLDKKPLEEGQITFLDSSGRPPASMTITEGKYQGKAHAGNYRVEIRAYRLSEKALAPGPGVSKYERPKENYLPERFNTKSEFKKAEVKPEGPNQFDYEVESK
jgi:hypothetical protein